MTDELFSDRIKRERQSFNAGFDAAIRACAGHTCVPLKKIKFDHPQYLSDREAAYVTWANGRAAGPPERRQP